MPNFNKTLSKRLRLNHAYGQLIALIFVPIMILTCVGAFLVLTNPIVPLAEIVTHSSVTFAISV